MLITSGVDALSAVNVSKWSRLFSAFDRRTVDPTEVSLRGFLFSQLAVGSLSVSVMAAQFSTPTIRATLAAGARMTVAATAEWLGVKCPHFRSRSVAALAFGAWQFIPHRCEIHSRLAEGELMQRVHGRQRNPPFLASRCQVFRGNWFH